MILNLFKKDLSSLTCPTLVVFSKIGTGKDKSARITHPELGKRLASAIADGEIKGKHLEHVLYRGLEFDGFRNVLVIGLGADADFGHEQARQVGACINDALKAGQLQEAAVHVDGLTTNKKAAPAFVQSLTEGLTLSSYEFTELKSKKKDDAKETLIHLVSSLAGDAAVKKAFHDAVTLADAVNFSRYLGDMPGNLMTPTILAEKAVEAAKGTGIKVTVWDKKRIEKERMGGLLGVSRGSDQEPRFIIMEYKGGAASKAPLVLVGKGLTFDCGGISIKPSAGMEEMKFDMCGGANVIGAILAIARLKLKVNVTCLVASTENMPGPSATKPGDIHTARNGKTFEVNNTDAEGRLILADALSYATELKPAAILDAATLTGAMVVALGNIHTGFFTRNDGLNKKIQSGADVSGELVWRMPLVDHHVKDMKGTYADLSNISASKGAGSATAAAFLEQFVGEGIPWAHFDIAGTGWAAGNRLNYTSKKGASGVMVRTFVEIARAF